MKKYPELIVVFMIFLFPHITQGQNDNLENIKGSRLNMQIPNNFKQNKGEIGIVKDENTSINIYDLILGNYYSNSRNFTEANFISRGIKVFEFKEFEYKGYPAKYTHIQISPYQNSINLLFGDTTFSVSIIGHYNPHDKISEKEIKSIILNCEYDKSKVIEPFENAFFNINDKNTELKLSHYTNNMYIYAPKGKLNDNIKSGITITPIINIDTTLTVKQNTFLFYSKLKEQGLQNMKLKNSSNKAINNYQSYQLILEEENIKNSHKVLFIKLIRHNYYEIIVQGIIFDKEYSIDLIEELINTIEIDN